MPRLELDLSLLTQLLKIKEPVEIVGPDGRVVGHFTPVLHADPREWGRPPLSDEELAERKREGGRSLSEILVDLEKRG
jgi:hypothetical protein